MNANEPSENFGNGILLAITNYILEIGMENTLLRIKESNPMDLIKAFPFVYEEIKKIEIESKEAH